jgi:hypothetical protein
VGEGAVMSVDPVAKNEEVKEEARRWNWNLDSEKAEHDEATAQLIEECRAS